MKLIFGKENNLTLNDLAKIINKRENEILEAKLIDEPSKLSDSVFKPLVGFLNKLDGQGGVLVLGVKAKQNKIESIVGSVKT